MNRIRRPASDEPVARRERCGIRERSYQDYARAPSGYAAAAGAPAQRLPFAGKSGISLQSISRADAEGRS